MPPAPPRTRSLSGAPRGIDRHTGDRDPDRGFRVPTLNQLVGADRPPEELRRSDARAEGHRRSRERDRRGDDGRGRESRRERDGRDARERSRSRDRDRERRERDKRDREERDRRERASRVKRKLAQAVKECSRTAALECALDMIEMGEKPRQDLLRPMLENAAVKPGADLFAKTLQCCVLGGIRLDADSFMKLLGKMLSRDASHAQIRAVLNMALPRGSPFISLVPDDLSVEETRVAFQDNEVTLNEQEDGEAAAANEPELEVEIDDDEEQKEEGLEETGVPEVLVLVNCEANPELNGEYFAMDPMPEVLFNNRPIYAQKSEDPDAGSQVYAYFWTDESKPWSTGWWLASEVGSEDVLAYNPDPCWTPPKRHWQVLVAGQRVPDPATFILPGEEVTDILSRNPEEAEEALSRLDLRSLQGSVSGKTPMAEAYFGHFVTLMHLEHLAEIGTYRKRMLRHPLQKLVKFGSAFDGLEVFATYGRRENKRGLLPGWPDRGTEFVAFKTPWGVDLERIRIRKGDSVVLSRTDPLKDRIAEGTVVDIDRKKTVVNLNGKMPGDARQARWRLDAFANRTVYDRQVHALLKLVAQDKPDPLLEMLVSGKVGQLDTWAQKHVGEKTAAKLPPWKKQAILHEQRTDPHSAGAEDSKTAILAKENIRGIDPAKVADAMEEVENLTDLNTSQREAVMCALTRRCTVIQGPPGTGKTHVSVKILQLWAKTMGLKPLLATSDSNVAVDNIAEGLDKAGVKAVRVGRVEKVRGHLDHLTLESIAWQRKEEKEAEKEAMEMQREEEECGMDDVDDEMLPPEPEEEKVVAKKTAAQELQADHDKKRKQRREDFEERMKILDEMEVICATTIAAGGDFLDRFQFHGILVDEVAQATELSTIVPVALRSAKQLVLVGDHCQLPPSVVSREAEFRGLSLSVYNRLVDAGVKAHFLDTQYRSHPKLAEFSAKCFYHGALKSGVRGSARPSLLGIDWPNSKVPVAFFEVGEFETVEGESKMNMAEVQMIHDLVFDVVEQGELGLIDIGVVTPYMAQVRALRRRFRESLPDINDYKMLEIGSVDSYQGREKELIVFSAVRSNRRGNVGFLADWRRLNVMITRARRGLVVFGAAATLRYNSHWQQWLEWCYDHEATAGSFTGTQNGARNGFRGIAKGGPAAVRKGGGKPGGKPNGKASGKGKNGGTLAGGRPVFSQPPKPSLRGQSTPAPAPTASVAHWVAKASPPATPAPAPTVSRRVFGGQAKPTPSTSSLLRPMAKAKAGAPPVAPATPALQRPGSARPTRAVFGAANAAG